MTRYPLNTYACTKFVLMPGGTSCDSSRPSQWSKCTMTSADASERLCSNPASKQSIHLLMLFVPAVQSVQLFFCNGKLFLLQSSFVVMWCVFVIQFLQFHEIFNLLPLFPPVFRFLIASNLFLFNARVPPVPVPL